MLTEGLHLQCILGGDKKNPIFSLARNESEEDSNLYVFLGAALLEVVPDDKNALAFKLLIARMFNSGFQATAITKAFGTARTTMERWGNALKSGDPKKLINAFLGQGAHPKMTTEIRAYINIRFSAIYEKNKYSYNKTLRKEIKEVFGVELSAETIRPFLVKLKEEAINETGCSSSSDFPENYSNAQDQNRSNACDLQEQKENIYADESCKSTDLIICPSGVGTISGQNNRNNSIKSETINDQPNFVFCHHLGFLIFSEMINDFSNKINEPFITQLLVTILLGAKNIEQTKLLDFDALSALLGNDTIESLRSQRIKLGKIATEENITKLFRYNFDLANISKQTDFYFDPHTKHYTGQKKILKGWCSNLKFADKIINMDFFHTPDGFPVYLSEADNYCDIRERFKYLVPQFRSICQMPEDTLTFIIDRGIYSFDLFEEVIATPNLHIITWEKNYIKGQTKKGKSLQHFSIGRYRNNSTDILKYNFEYTVSDWAKNPSMRQIVVFATNPNGNEIDVSILTDDKDRPVEKIIRLMFKRWIQENDFKYLDQHYGINEITSYDSVIYSEIENLLEDKQVKTGEYKAIIKNEGTKKNELKALLLKRERNKNIDTLKSQIIKLNKDLDEITTKKGLIIKEESKIEALIKDNYEKLDTRKKHFSDVVKIIARNIFYRAFEPFKKQYDNNRDDHVYFRHLTQCHGHVYLGKRGVDVFLFPMSKYQPKLKKIIILFLENLNKKELKFPDKSGRPIFFKLANKCSNQRLRGINLTI